MTTPALPLIVEALLIASESPLPLDKLASIIRERGGDASVTPRDIAEAISSLNDSYRDRAFHIQERPKGWKIYTRAEFSSFLSHLTPEKKAPKLSQPAVETLAIIAYRQPITRSSMEAIRGVACDSMVQKLLDMELIQIAGRADLPGRPLLYSTTDRFFDHFGIKTIDELPNAAELMNVPLPTATSEA